MQGLPLLRDLLQLPVLRKNLCVTVPPPSILLPHLFPKIQPVAPAPPPAIKPLGNAAMITGFQRKEGAGMKLGLPSSKGTMINYLVSPEEKKKT